MAGHEGDGLGHVERGAAAEADDGVRLVGAERLDARDHLAVHGIARDAGELAGGQRPAAEQAEDLLEDGQRGEALVGDEQRAPEALLLEVGAQHLARAGAEMDEGRKGKA